MAHQLLSSARKVEKFVIKSVQNGQLERLQVLMQQNITYILCYDIITMKSFNRVTTVVISISIFFECI